MNADPSDAEASELAWASDEEVRVVLKKAGIELSDRDPTDKRLGGPDCRARDAVIADSDMPLVREGAPDRAKAMRAARRYDRWRRAGGSISGGRPESSAPPDQCDGTNG